MAHIFHWVTKVNPSLVAAAAIIAAGFAIGMSLLKPTQITIHNYPPAINPVVNVQAPKPILQIRKLEKNLDLKQVK